MDIINKLNKLNTATSLCLSHNKTQISIANFGVIESMPDKQLAIWSVITFTIDNDILFICTRAFDRTMLDFCWCLYVFSIYLSLFTYSGVQHILLCVFVLFFFILCTLYASFSGLSFLILPFRYSLERLLTQKTPHFRPLLYIMHAMTKRYNFLRKTTLVHGSILQY